MLVVWKTRQVTDQGLVLADQTGTIRLWNEVATALFGHHERDAVGSSLDMIVPEEYRDRHWVGFNRAWSDGLADTPRFAMMPVLCADGEVRRFAGHLLGVKGPHGALAAIAGIYSPPSEADASLFVMG